jgi:hypothetical protein
MRLRASKLLNPQLDRASREILILDVQLDPESIAISANRLEARRADTRYLLYVAFIHPSQRLGAFDTSGDQGVYETIRKASARKLVASQNCPRRKLRHFAGGFPSRFLIVHDFLFAPMQLRYLA